MHHLGQIITYFLLIILYFLGILYVERGCASQDLAQILSPEPKGSRCWWPKTIKTKAALCLCMENECNIGPEILKYYYNIFNGQSTTTPKWQKVPITFWPKLKTTIKYKTTVKSTINNDFTTTKPYVMNTVNYFNVDGVKNSDFTDTTENFPSTKSINFHGNFSENSNLDSSKFTTSSINFIPLTNKYTTLKPLKTDFTTKRSTNLIEDIFINKTIEIYTMKSTNVPQNGEKFNKISNFVTKSYSENMDKNDLDVTKSTESPKNVGKINKLVSKYSSTTKKIVEIEDFKATEKSQNFEKFTKFSSSSANQTEIPQNFNQLSTTQKVNVEKLFTKFGNTKSSDIEKSTKLIETSTESANDYVSSTPFDSLFHDFYELLPKENDNIEKKSPKEFPQNLENNEGEDLKVTKFEIPKSNSSHIYPHFYIILFLVFCVK